MGRHEAGSLVLVVDYCYCQEVVDAQQLVLELVAVVPHVPDPRTDQDLGFVAADSLVLVVVEPDLACVEAQQADLWDVEQLG